MTACKLPFTFLAGTVALLSVGFALGNAPAHASERQEAGLSYSTDGVNYSSEPPPIFANTPKLTPGEEIEEHLWIHNSRPHTVDYSLQTNSTDNSTGILLGADVSGSSTLGSGETTAVTVRAWLPATAGNQTQDQSSELIRITVLASDADPLITAPEESEEQASEKPVFPSPGALGDTGYSAEILPLALGAIVTGTVLFARSRRRSNQSIIADRNQP